MENTPISPVSVVVFSMLSKGPGEASRAWVSWSLRVDCNTPRWGMPTSSSTYPLLTVSRLGRRRSAYVESMGRMMGWYVAMGKRNKYRRPRGLPTKVRS